MARGGGGGAGARAAGERGPAAQKHRQRVCRAGGVRPITPADDAGAAFAAARSAGHGERPRRHRHSRRRACASQASLPPRSRRSCRSAVTPTRMACISSSTATRADEWRGAALCRHARLLRGDAHSAPPWPAARCARRQVGAAGRADQRVVRQAHVPGTQRARRAAPLRTRRGRLVHRRRRRRRREAIVAGHRSTKRDLRAGGTMALVGQGDVAGRSQPRRSCGPHAGTPPRDLVGRQGPADRAGSHDGRPGPSLGCGPTLRAGPVRGVRPGRPVPRRDRHLRRALGQRGGAHTRDRTALGARRLAVWTSSFWLCARP